MKKYAFCCIVLLFAAFSLCSCGKREQVLSPGASPAVSAAPVHSPAVAEGEELLCLCDSQEEAERIAGLYGIELVEYSYGVATFHAEGDLSALIEQGKAEGWPGLSFNGTDYALH